MDLTRPATSFWTRHRNKFFIAAGVVSSAYLAGQWVSAKLSEMNERAALERTARDNLKKRFEQNQQDCSFTTMALLPDLGERLLSELNVEALTARLQQKRALAPAGESAEGGDGQAEAQQPELDKREKLRLWSELKTMAFTRTASSVYLVSLLSMLTHLQLNLLGRFIYLDSVVQIDSQTTTPTVSLELDGEAKPSLDAQTERQYLLFSAYLLTEGWRRLVDRVKHAVEETVGNVDLRQPVTYDDLVTYVENIRAKVEVEEAPSQEAFGRGVSGSSTIPKGLPHSFEQYLLPEPGSSEELDVLRNASHNSEESISPQLAGLLETSHRLLGARDFQAVLRGALDDGFEILLKSLKSPTFFPREVPGAPAPALREVQDGEAEPASGPTGEERGLSPPMASILPPVTRQVHQVLHSGLPNEYLRAIGENVGVKGWSAVVYAGFSGDSF
ncbi:Peroxin-3 [Hyaloraphidium curvatum]|nr:Peroxin-3 [Hyaloraphidium curvatum]